jgi:5-methylcytosine-specific restriction protein A
MSPRRPLKPCSHPGCNELVESGKCEKHQHAQSNKAKLYERQRGSAHSRGYDRRWQVIRHSVLSESPLCILCQKHGRVTAASEVHHIIPLAKGGTHDYNNLMPLCKSCHSEITIRESGYNAK